MMKDRIKNILKCIGIILLLLLFSSLFFSFFGININNISDKKYLIYFTISKVLLLGIFIYIYRNKLVNDFKSFFKDFSRNIDTSIKYWLVGLGIMYVSNIIITFVLKKDMAGNEELVRSYISIMPILMIFSTSIYAPICEELTFRGSIREAINNKWIYVIVSGLLFGFLHIADYITNISDLIYLIPYSAVGICFALLYYKTNNIFSSISVHFIHNTISILLVILLGALV